MAFVNEKLTNEQREEFVARSIKNPASVSGIALSPIFWTIDHENDMCLIKGGVHRDYHNEYYFVFLWKGEQHIVSLVMETKPYTVIWNNEVQASTYGLSTSAPFVEDLKSALTIFKVDGSTRTINENAEVIFNF